MKNDCVILFIRNLIQTSLLFDLKCDVFKLTNLYNNNNQLIYKEGIFVFENGKYAFRL